VKIKDLIEALRLEDPNSEVMLWDSFGFTEVRLSHIQGVRTEVHVYPVADDTPTEETEVIVLLH